MGHIPCCGLLSTLAVKNTCVDADDVWLHRPGLNLYTDLRQNNDLISPFFVIDFFFVELFSNRDRQLASVCFARAGFSRAGNPDCSPPSLVSQLINANTVC